MRLQYARAWLHHQQVGAPQQGESSTTLHVTRAARYKGNRWAYCGICVIETTSHSLTAQSLRIDAPIGYRIASVFPPEALFWPSMLSDV
jgi:hypothetical protein